MPYVPGGGLVKRYEKFVGRPLTSRSVRLPDGERLVCDAYDADANALLEARSSSSRQDVRMATGQLFDCQRHVAKGAKLAVLLPSPPSGDLPDLLGGLGIAAVIEERGGFRTA